MLEPALSAKTASAPNQTRVAASMTIAANGTVQSVTTSGGDGYPGLAACIQGALKSWRFPQSDDTSQVNVPFIFAAQ